MAQLKRLWYPVESPLDSNFLLMYILSQPFLDQVKAVENRVKMPKLNQESLVQFMIPVPPQSEQSRIVTRVESLRHLCIDLREGLNAVHFIKTQMASALIELQD